MLGMSSELGPLVQIPYSVFLYNWSTACANSCPKAIYVGRVILPFSFMPPISIALFHDTTFPVVSFYPYLIIIFFLPNNVFISFFPVGVKDKSFKAFKTWPIKTFLPV